MLYIHGWLKSRIAVQLLLLLVFCQLSSAPIFISQFGSNGSGPGQFLGSSGIEINPNNNQLIVADNSLNTVQIFDITGNFISQFGSSGTGNAQFDHANHVLITDAYIMVIDHELDIL